MKVEEALTSGQEFAIDACIVANTVDDVIHLALPPDEPVTMFCYAQRFAPDADIHATTIVLAESHLLIIRPTAHGHYALDLSEDLRHCSLQGSKRRPDGSLLIAIDTPVGLLKLHIDASWMAQADLLEAAFAHPNAPLKHEVSPADGISFDGDSFGVLQLLSGLADDDEDVADEFKFASGFGNTWSDGIV